MAGENIDLVAQLATQRLGPDPAAAAAAAAAAQGGAPGAQPPQQSQLPVSPPKADPSPTEMEKAQAKLAPNAADAQAAEQAVRFLKVGDGEYTEDQIKGTLGRYRDLNYKWQTEVAPNKPVLEVVRQLTDAARKAGHDPKGEEVAALIQAAVQAYVKNPTMGNKGGADDSGNGGDGKPKAPMSGNDDGSESAFSEWEKENAVKLPPGFRDMAKGNKELRSQMGMMVQLMRQLVQGGAADAQQAQAQAGQAVATAQQAQAQSIARMIGTNLEGAFTQAGLTADDQARADFRLFAAQRGYDLGDFMDPQLALTVVNDYKANKDAPEINRLREIARKRAAFTGNVEGAPGSGGAGAGAAAAPADPMLASMIGNAMQKRGM